MNERVLELAEQAWAATAVSAEFGHPVSFAEKLAELIVRQCADICLEMAAKCGGIPGDGALAKDCAYWIKKDFGVE